MEKNGGLIQLGLVTVLKKRPYFTDPECQFGTLSHSCLKVHAGVPLALFIFLDPLVLRINCLVIRELLTVLFLNPESSIINPQAINPYLNVNKQRNQYKLLWQYIQYFAELD